MKIPLLTLLLTATAALASDWATLSKIGDEIELKKGQTALIVSVSEPSYLSVKDSTWSSRDLRVRPYRKDFRVWESRREDYPGEVEVGWRQPFVVSGPCKLRLGTDSVVTLRMIGGPPRR
ncbi:hypothetical protein HAHE_26620 [Haloferula helveola]|uniref:Uncharacterized protein n=1 Tax=Haloferula helveola TaxID=490095 RepID=A0ABM7RB57_9BACT|nr:hypothetical protein HAHE_26620 [Haloferula helveola]